MAATREAAQRLAAAGRVEITQKGQVGRRPGRLARGGAEAATAGRVLPAGLRPLACDLGRCGGPAGPSAPSLNLQVVDPAGFKGPIRLRLKRRQDERRGQEQPQQAQPEDRQPEEQEQAAQGEPPAAGP
jgi:hypothetical protein